MRDTPNITITALRLSEENLLKRNMLYHDRKERAMNHFLTGGSINSFRKLLHKRRIAKNAAMAVISRDRALTTNGFGSENKATVLWIR